MEGLTSRGKLIFNTDIFLSCKHILRMVKTALNGSISSPSAFDFIVMDQLIYRNGRSIRHKVLLSLCKTVTSTVNTPSRCLHRQTVQTVCFLLLSKPGCNNAFSLPLKAFGNTTPWLRPRKSVLYLKQNNFLFCFICPSSLSAEMSCSPLLQINRWRKQYITVHAPLDAASWALRLTDFTPSQISTSMIP